MQSSQPHLLSPAEVNALTSACSRRSATGLRNRALINLLHRTGLRVSEALALRPTDLDLATGKGVVTDSAGFSREFAVFNGTLAMLEQWLAARERVARDRDWDSDGSPIFCTLTGTGLSPRYVQALLDRAATKAGIGKKVNPQCLRESFAASLLRDGADASEIQQALGHRNPRSTERYLHRFEGMGVGGAAIHQLHEHRERLQPRRQPEVREPDDVSRVLVELLLDRGLSIEALAQLLSRASAV